VPLPFLGVDAAFAIAMAISVGFAVVSWIWVEHRPQRPRSRRADVVRARDLGIARDLCRCRTGIFSAAQLFRRSRCTFSRCERFRGALSCTRQCRRAGRVRDAADSGALVDRGLVVPHLPGRSVDRALVDATRLSARSCSPRLYRVARRDREDAGRDVACRAREALLHEARDDP
jgi:hypothetical protein